MGVTSERKYAAEGGPAFRDLFALTREYSTLPGVDVLRLVDAAVFNLAIGNADAHGKNFSFLVQRAGARLAPLYDLLATTMGPELSPRSAMRIGGASVVDELSPGAWARFAQDAGVTLPFLKGRVTALADWIEREAAVVLDVGRLNVRTALRAGLVRPSLH